MLLGENTSKNFRQKWLEIVPVILAAGKKQRQPNVDALLKLPRFTDIDTNFGNNTPFILSALKVLYLFLNNATQPLSIIFKFEIRHVISFFPLGRYGGRYGCPTSLT